TFMLFISLSPNVEKDDWRRVGKLIFQPWRWVKGQWIEKLKEIIADYFQTQKESIFLFNSGRSSLLTILKSLDLPANSQVLLQAFTCNAAVNPILWAGLKPVFVDVDQSFNVSPEDLENKIKLAENPKVLMVQHTFGWPARMDKILSIAKKYNLIVIEDCAHSLGAKYQDKKIGTFGDFAFFSFGRDKIISSVYGGAVLINNPKYRQSFQQEYQKVKFSSYFWTFQQLLHPLIMAFLVLPFYRWQIGKIILVACQKLKLLSMAVAKEEREGKKPNYFPARLPNALAELAYSQWQKLDRFRQHRQMIAEVYSKELENSSAILPMTSLESQPSFLRYPILISNPRQVWQKAKKQGILLGDWYWSPIIPPGTDLAKMDYQKGSCPMAEKYCQQIINLPTHINTTSQQAQKICQLF
ncbi:MAG: hypothetical protein GWP10_07690, partial [Nitrospiraceae bacterium]|nr:hypothetical protein [Nitrospiraceae bacterium]